MGKRIGNVGVLDLTSATEESINEIESIENVGALLFSRNTARLASKIRMGNLGVSDVVPENCKVMQGRVDMSHSYFESVKEPLSLFINGQVIIKQDVTPEDIEKGIGFLEINGQIICPEKLAGPVQSKCSKINGKLITYNDNYYVSIGKIDMDSLFMRSLDDSSSLALIGKVTAVNDVDQELFERKINNIDIVGSLLVREECYEFFNKKLRNRDSCKVEIIPEGFTYIDEDLYVNSMTIRRFKDSRLYVSGMIRFDDDLSADMLEGRILSIKANDIIICRSDIAGAVFDRCDLSAAICDYSGKVIVVDGEHTMTQPELKYSPERISYIVEGSLKIGSDVLLESLLEKIEYIYNFGEIICSPQVSGALQSKIRRSSGEINQSTEGEEDSNIGYLKL